MLASVLVGIAQVLVFRIYKNKQPVTVSECGLADKATGKLGFIPSSFTNTLEWNKTLTFL